MALYTEWLVANKTFKLRLTTMGTIALEEKLGRNPADIFLALSEGVLPKVKDIVLVLHQALQPFHSTYSIDKSAELLDLYFEEGHTVYEFLTSVVMKVFQSAGLLSSEDDDTKDDEEQKN